MNLLLLKLFPPKLMLLDRVCEIRRFGLQYIYDRVIIDLLSFTQSNYIYYVCLMKTIFYHWVKIPVNFRCRRDLNPKSFIQRQENFIVDLMS